MKKFDGNTGQLFLFIAISFTLSLLIQACLAQERRIDPEIQRQIDGFIENIYLPGAKTQSIGLTIVQNDGKLLYTTGYGMSNIEKGIPYGNETQSLLGSVSKSFTAVLAVKHLHERFPHLGETVLDTPIRKLLPQINFTLIDRFRSEHATFRDLLAHRTCLFDTPLMAEPFNTTEEMIYRMRYNEEECGMRGDFIYSNQIYVMVGWLAGILADKPYEDAIQDLWNELGMLNTTFVKRTDDFTQMPYRAVPYYLKDDEILPMNTELIKRVITSNPSGGIYSTQNDLSKYLQFHLNQGSFDGNEIIPRDVFKWLYKPSNMLLHSYHSFKESNEDIIVNRFGYGMGLFLSSYDGWEYPQHGGIYPPYFNQMSFFPTQKLSIFTNTHVAPFKMSPFVLHGFIFEILKGNLEAEEKAMKILHQINAKEEREIAQFPEKNCTQVYAKLVKKAGSLDNQVINVGKYGSGNAGELELSERVNSETNQTQYFIDYGKWYQGWLDLVEGDALFRVKWITDVVQEDYAVGVSDRNFAIIVEDTLTLCGTLGPVATFQLGLKLDLLPAVPWDPISC